MVLGWARLQPCRSLGSQSRVVVSFPCMENEAADLIGTRLPAGEREREPGGWKEAWRKLLRSRVTFVVLQVLDLGTTLAVFHAGGFEANPLVASLTAQFGRFRGVLISKLAAVTIAMGVRRL